jgi:DNA-binding CsgD family transcriptional regulator
VTRASADADEQALLGAAEFLAGSDSLQTLRRRTVDILPTLVHTTMVAWNEVDLSGKRIDAVTAPELTLHRYQELDKAFVDHVGDHPVIAYHARTGDGRPHAISDFLDAPSFHATGIYRHFYRVLGAEDQLSFILPDPVLVVGIALNRSRRGFSDRDRRMCNLLRPHLLQAYRNVDTLARVERLLATVDRLASDQDEEVVVLGHRGRVEYLSPGARVLLEQFFGPIDRTALSSRLLAWAEDNRARTLNFPGNPHVVEVQPLRIADGYALLFCAQPAAATGPDLQRFGLTARESQVLKLVNEGLQTKQIASALRISPRTVDKHIGRSLDKLGVGSRISAVHLISRQLSEARRRTPDRATAEEL